MMRFYQGHKSTTVLPLKFEGKQELYFVEETGESSRFKAKCEEQKRDHGIFDIEVKADLLVRVKLGRIRIGIFQPEIRCGLVVPLVTTGKGKSPTARFNSTECGVQFKADSLFDPLD